MDQPKKNEVFCFRLSDERRAEYDAAARKAGRTLADWIRRQCDQALLNA